MTRQQCVMSVVRCVQCRQSVACAARPVRGWRVDRLVAVSHSDSAAEQVTWVSRRLRCSWHAAHHPGCLMPAVPGCCCCCCCCCRCRELASQWPVSSRACVRCMLAGTFPDSVCGSSDECRRDTDSVTDVLSCSITQRRWRTTKYYTLRCLAFLCFWLCMVSLHYAVNKIKSSGSEESWKCVDLNLIVVLKQKFSWWHNG